MISFVSGEIYNLQIEGNEIPLEPIQTFFAEGHEDDLICVRTAWGKKLYINKMDARFAFQGLLSICHKLSVPCAYIKSKGYIPIIRIKSSYQSHYSDFVGEDIWSKFFVQPEKCSVQAYANSASVTFSSNFNMSFSGMWLMEQIAHCGRMNLVGKKFFNYELKKYVDERRAKISGGGYTCSGCTDTWNGLCGQQTAWA